MISFKHFVDFLESSKSLFWSLDLDTQQFEYLNVEKFEELYQRPIAYFDGGLNSWIEFFHPEDQGKVVLVYEQFECGEIEFSTNEYRIILPNGDLRWIQVHTKICENQESSHRKIIGTTTDITHQKVSEEKLISLNNRLDKILETGGLGSWDYFIQSDRVVYDKRWGDMLGVDISTYPQDISTWQKFSHPDDCDVAFNLAQAYIRGETEIYESIFRMRHAHGHWLWILARGKISQWSESGDPICMTGTHLDITVYKDNEVLLDQIQDMAKIGGWEMDLKSEKTLWTDQVYKIYGHDDYVPTAIIDGLDCYAEHEKARLVNYLNKCMLGDPFDGVFEFIDIKGRKKWVESKGWPIFDADGSIRKLRGTFQDVTQVHRQQLELTSYIQGLDRYAIVATTNNEGTILSVNQAFIEISGYSQEELIGKGCQLIQSGYHEPAFFKDMWDTINSGKQWHGQIKNRAKSGDFYWVETTITPKFDSAGKISEFLAFQYNVTQQKNTELKLKNQLRLQDLQKRLETKNFERENLNHVKDDLLHELQATKWLPVVLDVDYFRPAELSLLYKKIGNEEIFRFENYELIGMQLVMRCSTNHLDKGSFVINFASAIVIDNLEVRDFVAALSSCLADIIARLEIKSELNEQRQITLHHSKLASIGQLAAGIGHEINNPLMIINGYVDKIFQDLRDRELMQEDHHEWFDRIQKSSMRITNIVKGIASFSRRDSNKMEIISLSELVLDCCHLVQEIYAKEHIQISPIVEPGINILGNYGKMQQIVMNLISNARDAVGKVDHKRIKVLLRSENKTAYLEIHDNGVGIASEIRDMIFDPFFTTKEVNKGTGLGLSLAYGLVQEHGGSIKFHSTENEGTVFTLRFRLQDTLPEIKKDNDLEMIADVNDSSLYIRRRALIVDDEFFIRDLLRGVLEKMNFDIEEAVDGVEAFDKINSDEAMFDLVITDYKMPRMNGLEFYLSLPTKVRHYSKFLFITGDANSVSQTLGFDNHDLHVLYKPFNSKQLDQYIRDLFR